MLSCSRTHTPTHTDTHSRRGISPQDITAVNKGSFSLSEKSMGGTTKEGGANVNKRSPLLFKPAGLLEVTQSSC